ncbi:aldolase/citrate lyase family protein [Candidatus Pelagibacter sp.]|nr:aldolase/citrate lyase family protein [Candidatus Pelagibacter sp.]|tara:strand:- start:1143 stop:1886 length:744 start_codon:yes stop_codon:yes gene_type:complete
MIKRIETTLSKIKKNQLTIGSWLQVANADSAEIIANSNFDWAAIDLEHGTIPVSEITNIVRALELGGTLPIVRMKSKSLNSLGNIWDSGVRGMIIPNIETAKEIESIIDKSYYLPQNKRGIGFSRANQFGRKLKEYHQQQKKNIIFAMIESKKGLMNLDEILKVKNLDGVFIGPYDLSASLGLFEKFESKKFKSIVKSILKRSIKNKKLCGIHIVDNDKKILKSRIEEGYKFLAFSTDTVILKQYKI